MAVAAAIIGGVASLAGTTTSIIQNADRAGEAKKATEEAKAASDKLAAEAKAKDKEDARQKQLVAERDKQKRGLAGGNTPGRGGTLLTGNSGLGLPGTYSGSGGKTLLGI